MRTLLILMGLLALAGCAAQRQAQFNEGAAKCKAEIPAVIGNYMKREQCINDAATSAGFHGPAEDLVSATRVALAEKVDSGAMTVAEANVQFAQMKYEIQQEAAAQRAANAQAAAAILSAMPRPQPYVVPACQIPVSRPWNATCTQMGNYTTCNGN